MDWYDIKLRREATLRWLTLHKPKITFSQHFLLLAVQLIGTGCVLYGISLYSHPVAFIIGGIGAILAMEMQVHKEEKLKPEQVHHFQQQIKSALAKGEDPFGEPYNVPLNPDWISYAASLRRQR